MPRDSDSSKSEAADPIHLATARRLWRKLAVFSAPIRHAFRRMAAAGTQGYPPDTVRRLKILNVIAILIAIANSLYAIQLAATDYDMMAPAVWLNAFLALLAATVPFAHRINDIAGGLILVTAEFIALYGFTWFFSRSAGAPLQYMVAAAAPFVIFGLRRLWLVLAIVALALLGHLISWLNFPTENAYTAMRPDVLNSLYIQGAVTTFALIAACVYYAFSLAERAKAETDAVLRNVLPDSVVERLKSNPDETIFDSFPSASILFADITGFVATARALGPEKTVELLNRLVRSFDALAQSHGVEKIKTIGDAYMVASGVPIPRNDHLIPLADMALDMLDETARISKAEGVPIALRIGMAAGPIMAGVIGTKKFSYDVWGDPVNLASRLESASAPGKILLCPACKTDLAGSFTFESRGFIDIKGVGQQETWYLIGRKHAEQKS